MIKANFNAYNNYVTDSLYQWDINQDLVIYGLNLSVAPEIHFANANTDRAIVRQSTLSNRVVTVRIPNSLLQEALTIKAHIGVYEGDTFKIVEIVEIPVIGKNRPSDYSFVDTDEEIYSFKALENQIANAKQTISDLCNTNLANMTTTLESTVNSLETRVSTMVSDSTETEGNAELIDIRTGFDDKVYPTAGDAMRNQVKTVSNTVGCENVYLINEANTGSCTNYPTDNGTKWFLDPIVGYSYISRITLNSSVTQALALELWRLNGDNLVKVKVLNYELSNGDNTLTINHIVPYGETYYISLTVDTSILLNYSTNTVKTVDNSTSDTLALSDLIELSYRIICKVEGTLWENYEQIWDEISSSKNQFESDINNLTETVNELNEGGLDISDELINEKINTWLDEHPEATTTIQDGSIEIVKLSNDAQLKTFKDYVTPQMFGAVGDGETDDYQALQKWLNYTKCNLKYLPSGTYATSKMLKITRGQRVIGSHKNRAVLKQIGTTDNYILNITGISVVVEKIGFNCNALSGGVAIKDFDTDDTRITGSKLIDCIINNVGVEKVGALLDCANGYNYFDHVAFYHCNDGCDTLLKIGDTYGGTYQGKSLDVNYVYILGCIFGGRNTSNDGTAIAITDSAHIWIDKCDLCNNANSNKYAIDLLDARYVTITNSKIFNNVNGIRARRSSTGGCCNITIDNCYLLQHDTVEGYLLWFNDDDATKNIYDVIITNNAFTFKHSNKCLHFTRVSTKFYFENNVAGYENTNWYAKSELLYAYPSTNNLQYPSCIVNLTYTDGAYSVAGLVGNSSYYTTSISGNVLTLTYTAFNTLSYLIYRSALLSPYKSVSNIGYVSGITTNETAGTLKINIVLTCNSDCKFAVAII